MDLSKTRRVDWRVIVEDLGGIRCTVAITGVAQATIRGWVSDDAPAEPRFWIGHRVLLGWCERTGKTLEDVPLRDVPLSISHWMDRPVTVNQTDPQSLAALNQAMGDWFTRQSPPGRVQ